MNMKPSWNLPESWAEERHVYTSLTPWEARALAAERNRESAERRAEVERQHRAQIAAIREATTRTRAYAGPREALGWRAAFARVRRPAVGVISSTR